jgi:adenosine deaminase
MMLPKAELHVHVEGTLEPELLVRLAARNEISLPTTDVEELRRQYRFSDLQSFLDVYSRSQVVLRTEQDFHDLADAYLERAGSQGVRRAEIFFDLQQHLENGVPAEAVFAGLGQAVTEGVDRYGVHAALILCFLRDRGGAAAMEAFRTAMPFRDQFIGVGLDSSEVGHPPSLFRDVFTAARSEGLHRVAHAGEEGGPDYVWEALDVLQVERVDHGNRAMEDPALVARLRSEQVPLTVCPLSNVALKVVDRLEEHPLPRMLAEGLRVTVNSDDPAYFGGYVEDNYAAVQAQLALSDADLVSIAANSFDACFVDESQRVFWKSELYVSGRGSRRTSV